MKAAKRCRCEQVCFGNKWLSGFLYVLWIEKVRVVWIMASQPNNRDSNAQRKILEDLQLKKQMILKQGVSQALSAPATSQQPTGWSSGTDGHIAGNSQRSSLLQATSSSFGYFIPQDSSFGNFILPVLPRLEPK